MGFLEFFFYGMYLRILSRKTIYGYPFPRCITNTYYCTLIMIDWFIRNNDFDGWKLGASTQTFTFASKMVLCASLRACRGLRMDAKSSILWSIRRYSFIIWSLFHRRVLTYNALFKRFQGLWLTSTTIAGKDFINF